ncbi:interleukin-27 receptor subunit alpha [Talpa occidentalis]|uniref:interleukin-27 receptor subunit alpha n=1 Tax=Talpa occidentalis TaxID=50954 RepID=UPI00188F327A|nr:interleukin-27 receptor subunit alpha [Talpa occidentalis]
MLRAQGDPLGLRPLPKLVLLPVLLLLFHRTRPHGSPGPLQCYGVGPFGDLNCSWEPFEDLGAPSMLHLQSQKYHSNRSWTVAVPPGQSWVTIPREQFTMSDELLVWGSAAGQCLWPQVFVNLETRMKPDAPWLYPDVDFLEDDPREATVQWAPPGWPPHKVLMCQFYYRRCQEMTWTLLEPEVKSIPLTPIEIRDLELATGYEVYGRCRMEKEEDLWGEESPVLSFQTLPSAPKDLWLSGHLCGTPSRQEPLLLWKAPGSCMQVSYTVWFQLENEKLSLEGIPCCNSSIPTQAKWAWVSAINATSWEPVTNLSLACLAPESAPREVSVNSMPGSTELLVTWQQGPGEPREHVVDWVLDGDALEDFNWIRLPPGNLSVLLPGNFREGVPYRITVTAISPWGLAPAPSIWKFREELAPLAGPKLQRLHDAPSGNPTIAWEEVPRHQLRGHLTHYTLCAQSGTRPSACKNVSGSAQNITLPNLPAGHYELWMTASTIAGQGPPGPSLSFHLPDNTQRWSVLPGVLVLWGSLLMGCGVGLVIFQRCPHLRHKVLPRWVWEKAPDPANSSFSQRHVEDVPQAQPPGDLPFLEVEEMEPLPVREPLQAAGPAPLDSGYEKHFLPTPEELGLLCPPSPQVLADLTPGQERGAHLTDEDTEDQRG